MILMHILWIAAVLSGGVLLGTEEQKSWDKLFQIEEHYALKDIIKSNYSMMECMAPKIRKLAERSKNWKEILNSANHTEHLLYMINRNLDNEGLFQTGFDLSVRNKGLYIHLELGAALLGTPGAIKFGTGYIQQDSAKERLKEFLFTVVTHGHRGGNLTNYLAWEDEDVDVVRAGLDMGLNLQTLNQALRYSSGAIHLLIMAAEANKVKVVQLLLDRGVDIEIKSEYETEYIEGPWKKVPCYTQKKTALYAAASCGSQDAVDLLIKRGANVNTTDTFLRTPLIMAAKYGCVEIVKQLLLAKAVVWLRDGFEKSALDYAQEGLSDNNEQQYQQQYQIIVQLLKDAGAV